MGKFASQSLFTIAMATCFLGNWNLQSRAAAAEDPPIGVWEETKEVPAPTGTFRIDARVEIRKDANGDIKIKIWGESTNALNTDNVGPNVNVELLNTHNGRDKEEVLSTYLLKIDETPARWFGSNTHKSGTKEETLKKDLKPITDVRITLSNRYHGSPIIDLIHLAAPLILGAL